MSAIPGGGVIFDIQAKADNANRVVDDAQKRIERLVSDSKKNKIEIPATIDTRQLQKDAEFSKEVIRGVQKEADKLFKARQQAFAALRQGAGGDGGGGDGGGGGGGGFSGLRNLTITTASIRQLESGLTGFAEAALNGTDKWKGFAHGLIEGTPIIGNTTARLVDMWEKLNDLRLLRAQGLNTPEENEAQGKVFDPGIRLLRGSQSALDAAEERQRRADELSGLSGFDLQRARARQRADEQSEAVGKGSLLGTDVLGEERTKIEERIQAVQKRIADDLEVELRQINAEEGVKEIGGAVKDWFKDLEEKVKNEARAAKLAERNQQEFVEEVDKGERKENELRLKRQRAEDKVRRRDAIDALEQQIQGAQRDLAFTGAGVQTGAATVAFSKGSDREQERKLQAMIDLLKQIRDKDSVAFTS